MLPWMKIVILTLGIGGRSRCSSQHPLAFVITPPFSSPSTTIILNTKKSNNNIRTFDNYHDDILLSSQFKSLNLGINHLTSRLCAASSSPSPSTSSSSSSSSSISNNNNNNNPFSVSSSHSTLLSWFQTHHSPTLPPYIHPSLLISPSQIPSSGNGLVTTTPLSSGTTIFTIPNSHTLDLNHALDDPFLGGALYGLSGHGGTAGRMASLVAKIVWEWLGKGEQQQGGASCCWEGYLNTIPSVEERNNHVLFWKEEELALLKGSVWDDAVEELIYEESVMREVLMEDIFPLVINDDDDALKKIPRLIRDAYVTLLSRSFHDDRTDSVKLIPLLDMGQHCRGKCNVRHESCWDTGDVTVVLSEDVAAGEELFLDYGEEKEEDEDDEVGMFPVFGFVPGWEGDVREGLRRRDGRFFPEG